MYGRLQHPKWKSLTGVDTTGGGCVCHSFRLQTLHGIDGRSVSGWHFIRRCPYIILWSRDCMHLAMLAQSGTRREQLQADEALKRFLSGVCAHVFQ